MWVVEMGNQLDSNNKIPCSWCIQAHNQNQWLHSTLSELDRSTKAMQTLIDQEDGNTFAQRAEMYYQRRPDLLKKVAEFRRSYHILAEYCSHLSVRSKPLLELGSFQSTTTTTKSSDTPNHESASTSTESAECDHGEGGARLAPAEDTVSCPEELARAVERAVSELARRNEEKRGAKRELEAQVGRLMGENDGLQRRLRETTYENAALRAKLKCAKQGKEEVPGRSSSEPSNVVAKRSKLSRLKAVIIGRSCCVAGRI